jgi:hypothetical protein
MSQILKYKTNIKQLKCLKKSHIYHFFRKIVEKNGTQVKKAEIPLAKGS